MGRLLPELYLHGLAHGDFYATPNGIWQMGYAFQLSGLYFFGSGNQFETTFGGDALMTGGTVGSLRARSASAGGGVVPRMTSSASPSIESTCDCRSGFLWSAAPPSTA